MNLSEICIRRPVLTTLVMARSSCSASSLTGCCRWRRCPPSTFPPSASPRHCRARAGDDGGVGGRADRAPALDHRRHHALTSSSSLGTRRSPSSSTSAATSTAPRWTCRPRCRRAAAPAGRNDDAAELPQGQSGRLPGPLYQPELADDAALGGERIWRDHAGAADFAAAGRGPGAGVRRAEIRRARAGRSGRRGGRNISLEDIRSVVAKANSSTPVGALNGPQAERDPDGVGRDTKAAEYRKVVVAYRNGAPVQLDQIARVIDSVENDKIASWFNETAPSCSRSSASPTPIRSTWWISCASGCRKSRAGAARDRHGGAERSLDVDP